MAAQPQLPPLHWPPQQSLSWVHARPSAAHPHTPEPQLALQQLAATLQAEPVGLHGAQTPPNAHTPLQHSAPVVQLPPMSVHAQVPALHEPLQHDSVVQLWPLRAQLAPMPSAPASLVVELSPEQAVPQTATIAAIRK